MTLASSLDEILSRHLPRTDGPGVQVVLVSPDGMLYEVAVGLANPVTRPNEKLTLEHEANLYSMSKFFTACCLLKLIEEGKLNPTDKVIDHIPAELQALVTNDCTIEQLVAHAGGASNPIPLRWVHTPDQNINETEILIETLKKHPFRAMPGDGQPLPYYYSNVGYWVLGHVVTTACNVQASELARCCQELLFSNIQLSKDEALSIVSDQFSPAAPMACGHVPRWSSLALAARFLCPKGIVGPTNGTWVQMEPHLIDGVGYGGLIGSARSVSIFLQSLLSGAVLSSTEPLFSPLLNSHMTFGLHVRPHRGLRVYHKEGGGPGCHSSVQFRQDQLAGCVIAGNATFDVNGLLDELMDCVADYRHAAATRTPQTRAVLASDGTALHTKLYSEKLKMSTLPADETLLFISGGPGVPDYLHDLASLMINSNVAASVLCFDQRGVGQSLLQPGCRITMDLLLDDIDAIRKAYHLEKIHILGHSWGGVLAQLYGQRYPDRVASLVLISPTTVSQASDWSNMEREVMKYNQRKGGWINFCKMGVWSLLMYLPLVSDYATRRLFVQAMKNYYFDPASAPDPPQDILCGVSGKAMIESKSAFLETVKEPISFDDKIPSMCLFGDEDIYGQKLVEDFCADFKGKTEILSQCSHLAWIDQPSRLECLLRSFYGD